MLKVTDDMKGLEMSFTLNERDGALLASFTKTEAFEIMQRLMEQEIRLLNIRLINTPTSKSEEILANHAVAKGAGMFYAGLIQRLQTILQLEQIAALAIGTAENPESPAYLSEFSGTPAEFSGKPDETQELNS